MKYLASLFHKLFRVNVDCQKQSVEPVEISFGALQQLKMIPNCLLSIRITEVGMFYI